MNDTLHLRHLKAIISRLPFALSMFTIVYTVFDFFIGNYASEGFPKSLFWIVAIVTTLAAWITQIIIALSDRYADPFMHQCITDEQGSVFYYFANRRGLDERAIVEIRKYEKGVAIPYAIAYIDSQDPMNKHEMLVRPIAYHIEGVYIKCNKSRIIADNKLKNYILFQPTFKKETLDLLGL